MLTSTAILVLSLLAAGLVTLAGDRGHPRTVESCARCGGETGKRGCTNCGWPFA